MTDLSGMSAGRLVVQTQRELAEVAEAIRAHRFLERLRTREVPEQRLRALTGEQHAIVSSDRRSFAQLTHASVRARRGILPRHGRRRRRRVWTSSGAWPSGSA
jgi:hypothetical protein